MAGPEPVRGGSGLEDVGPEGEPIDDCTSQARVGERLAPFGEGRVGGDRDRGSLIALGEDLEEQLGAPPVEVQVAQLIEAEQVDAAVAGDDGQM